MYPLNDKDLDRLSRDAAEHYDVESSASGWERLESKLDKELPVKEKDRKRFLFWLFTIALLTGGSLVYMLGRSPNANSITSGKTEAGSVGKVSATEVREADKKAPDNKATEFKTGVQQEKIQETTTPIPKTGVEGNNEPAISPSAEVKTDAVTKPIDKNNLRDRSRKLTTPQRRDDHLSVNNNKDLIKKSRNLPAADQTAIDLMKTTMPVIDAQKQYEAGKIEKDIPMPAADVAKKPEEKQNTSKPSKWAFGLLTGPDFSNVKFTHSYNTGFNLGFQVSYNISDRFSVNSGIIYNKKFYKANGEDYHPPKHTPQSYLDMQMIQGNCSMFEIPLNLRYDFALLKQNRFFVSSGLSSYLMNNEYYEYTYLRNGNLYDGKWGTDSSSQYFLSALNLSAGFEYNLSKRFSMQAEPYLKVPLRGLGYGSMRISSYGVYLTLRYRPQIRNK